MENVQRLSARQEVVLKAYVESLLPPLRHNSINSKECSRQSCDTENETPNEAAVQRFWEYLLSEDPEYIKNVSIAVLHKMTMFDRISFLLILYFLDTCIGTSIIFNHYSTTKRFADYSENDRTTILLPKLQYSPYCIRRKIFQSFKQVILGIAFTYHAKDTATTKYKNPYWEAIGYCGAPMDWLINGASDQERVDKAMKEQASIIQALKDSDELISAQISALVSAVPTSEKSAGHLQFDCDIVIVGSGSGGCVAAKELSKAGYDVIVLEQGMYLSPVNITQHEIHALDQQYVQNGLLQNTSGTIMILAGNALGGGTAINWSCCLPLPDYVREEWIQNHRLHDTFATTEYDESQKAVMHQLGAKYDAPHVSKPDISHNAMNRKLQQGCTELGYQWTETGQNLRDTNDVTAGYIGMGDRYGTKNGGIQSFLIHAVQHGARIFHQCRVTKIRQTPTRTRQQRATGVECRITCSDGIVRSMVVHARRRVVVAAGALYSPCLLRKSGFRNYHIGRHLRLHPVAAVMGFYPHEEPIDSILGAPMTTVCNEFASGPQQNGYGAKIECPCSYPGLLAAGSPWISSNVCKQRLFRYRNAVPLIALQRDSGDGGSVQHSLDGKSLLIKYKMESNDVKSILHSLQGAIQILVASGANEVATGHIHDTGFMVGKSNINRSISDEAAMQDYLSSIARRGMKDHEVGLFSAHQMGTCRMSALPQDGVVDPNGETWECDDLFVMDSSVFPTASGSNPMVTVLTIAHMLSTRLCLLLKLQEQVETGQSQGLSTRDVAIATNLYKRRKEYRKNVAMVSSERIKNGLIVACPIALGILRYLYVYWNFK